MKYFLGLEIPKAQREALAGIMDYPRCGITFERFGRIHVTVRFLGDLPPVIEKARAKLAGRQFQGRTDVVLAGVGRFVRPPVLWASFAAEKPLQNLRAQIDAVLGGGYSFNPHVTLAKGKQSSASEETIRAFLDENKGFRTDPWLMDRLTLFASPGGGADYQVVETYPIL